MQMWATGQRLRQLCVGKVMLINCANKRAKQRIEATGRLKDRLFISLIYTVSHSERSTDVTSRLTVSQNQLRQTHLKLKQDEHRNSPSSAD